MILKKKSLKIILIALLLVIAVVIALNLYARAQINKIPALTFEECMQYTTKNNAEAVISVGIIKDGEISYKVYGENASELPPERHIYEIGSITKTFTAYLLNQAEDEGLIDLNDPLNKYLKLPEGKNYPKIKDLLTHSSGYKNYYFERPMIGNFLKGRNSYYAIDKNMLLERVAKTRITEKEHDFLYSNFGYAVGALILEEIYGEDYRNLLNNFLQNDLELKDTGIFDGEGDLNNYWQWRPDDAYIGAGAITSTISDMLAYAEMQIENQPRFAASQRMLKKVEDSNAAYRKMDINIDGVATAWIIDDENRFIWHNGGTGHFNSYLGFCPETKTAVVILSNLPPNYRIPATVAGIKLLKELQ